MATTGKDVKRKTENERISKIPAENPKNPTGSYYDVLGVAPDATTDDIKAAFKNLSLLVHPDKNPDDPNAQDNFEKIKAARDVLVDDEKRKNYDSNIRAFVTTAIDNDNSKKVETPKEEAMEEATDKATDEIKAAPKNSIFKQAVKESDDLMIQMLKEWMNMIVDKYDGNLEGAAWEQVKSVYKAVKNYMSDQDSSTNQQTDNNIPKPKPQPISEEQLKLLGSSKDAIDAASNRKLKDLDEKINNCNDRIEVLGNKLKDDYAMLEANSKNQQPPMTTAEYHEKNQALYNKYQENYQGIIKEYEGYVAERTACVNAHGVLLNRLSSANDNTDAPPPVMTSGSDTRTLDNSIKSDALLALEWHTEQFNC